MLRQRSSFKGYASTVKLTLATYFFMKRYTMYATMTPIPAM